jgi:hypothetical protein
MRCVIDAACLQIWHINDRFCLFASVLLSRIIVTVDGLFNGGGELFGSDGTT